MVSDMPEHLLSEARSALGVSAEAAALYDRLRDLLVGQVNAALAEMASLAGLIGHLPLRVLHELHRAHAATMAGVLHFASAEMLLRETLWAYRAYRARGFSDAYFPAAALAWQEAALRHLPSPAGAEVARVYAFLHERHEDLAGQARLKPPPLPARTRGPGYHTFLNALLNGQEQQCISLARRHDGSSRTLSQFYLEVIQPALYEVGARWEQDRVPLVKLHLANSVAARAMAAIALGLKLPEPTRGKAVIASCQGEFHELGGRMIVDLMELDGWEVDFMGADTPTAALVDLLMDYRPQVLGISVTMSANLLNARQTIAAVRDRPDLSGVKVMVGGLALQDDPQLWRKLGADGYAEDALAALGLANRWQQA